MGKGGTVQQTGAYITRINHGERSLDFRHTLFAQLDVEHTQLSDKRLVLWEEERELGLLKGQRHGGSDDIGANVIGVVLGHQTRRYVNTDNLGLRGIDILDE